MEKYTKLNQKKKYHYCSLTAEAGYISKGKNIDQQYFSSFLHKDTK